MTLADIRIMSHNSYEKTGFFACAAHTALRRQRVHGSGFQLEERVCVLKGPCQTRTHGTAFLLDDCFIS